MSIATKLSFVAILAIVALAGQQVLSARGGRTAGATHVAAAPVSPYDFMRVAAPMPEDSIALP